MLPFAVSFPIWMFDCCFLPIPDVVVSRDGNPFDLRACDAEVEVVPLLDDPYLESR
jgi:hypothetical protein